MGVRSANMDIANRKSKENIGRQRRVGWNCRSSTKSSVRSRLDIKAGQICKLGKHGKVRQEVRPSREAYYIPYYKRPT